MLFPELTLCGYPPEDLLLHRGLRSRVEAAFDEVKNGVRGIAMLLGYPEYDGDAIYNSAALMRDGRVLANHRKQALPNYAVFDEKRYFQPGEAARRRRARRPSGSASSFAKTSWVAGTARVAARRPARELILVINGSPFHMHQQQRARRRARGARAGDGPAALYLNMVGGQDELVFDGGSCASTRTARCCFARRCSRRGCYVVELDAHDGGELAPRRGDPAPMPPLERTRLSRARARHARLRREARLPAASCSGFRAASTRR